MSGKSRARQLPSFFLRQMQLPIYPFESPNFLPTAKNKQVCLTRSLAYNVLRVPKFLRSMHYIQQVIRESEVDVVVNFYELLTGLTYLVYRPKAVLVCVAHQYLFLHPDFEFPRANRALPLLVAPVYEGDGNRCHQAVSPLLTTHRSVPVPSLGAAGQLAYLA